MQHDETARISWHIPDGQMLTSRAGMLRILFAGLVTVGFVLIMGAGTLTVSLAAAGVLAAAAAYWTWLRWRDAGPAVDNVWLDQAGLHWRDAGGQQSGIPREQVEGFRVGLDPDTMRAIPALTLLLAGGFESQPIELHEPATPQQVRQFMSHHWQVREMTLHDEEFAASLRQAIDAALAGDGRPPLAARLLSCRLITPQLEQDGGWRVAQLDELCVVYDRESCKFSISANGETLVTGKLADAVKFIRDEVLPEENDELAQLADEVGRLEDELTGRQAAADAQRAGFYFAGDDSIRLWKLVGARSRLLALCERMDDVAERLSPAPTGAKPAEVRIGGELVGLTIRADRRDWLAGDTIGGQKESLASLAEALREQISSASEDTATEFSVPFDSRGRWRFRLEVKDEAFDPARCIEAIEAHSNY